MSNDVTDRQRAAAEVEKKMLLFLLQYEPASGLTVGDIKLIAGQARNLSFNEFA